MKKTLIIILFSSISIVLKSQYAEFKHFSTDMGLSSSEVYCQMQDSAGYMWFGTSRGLSRFDGYSFKNYTASDGLPSNSIIKIFYDVNGRIWFATYDGSLSYYENSKFNIFSQNDTLIKLSKNYYVNNLFVDKDSSLWVMPLRGGIFEFDKNRNVHNRVPESYYSAFYFNEIDGGGVVSTYIRGQERSDSVYLEVNDKGFFIVGINNGFRKNVYKIRLGEYLISISNKLYYIRNNHIISIKTYKNEISGVFVDNKKNFWISVLYEGVYYYANSDLNALPEIYLSGMSPIAVFQDHQSGYWLSTTENGVFYSPSFQFISYKRFGIPLFNIVSLKIFNDFLYFSTYDRQVVKCSLSGHRIMSIQNLQLRSGRDYAIQDIVVTEDSSVWYLGNELIKEHNNKITIVDTLTRSYRAFARKNKVYINSDKGLNIYCDTICKTYPYDNLPTSNAIYVDDNEDVWIGTINGLFLFSNGEYSFLGDEFISLKARINDITMFEKYIVIATNGDGLFLYSKTTNELNILNENNGLNSNFVNTVFASDNDIWAGTNKGLCKINLIDNNDSLQIFTTQFTDIDGLYAIEIKDIDKNGDCLFLGTTKGLISFYPKNVEKNFNPPELHIDSILVNNTKIEIDTFYKFSPSNNTLTFYYKGISFSAGDKVLYKYKLEGYDEEWNNTADRFLRFPNLLPGEYTLFLLSSADGKTWNKTPIKIRFYIKKKFTRTLAFYILLIILIFISAGGILTFRFNRLEKDLRLKRRMMRAEQKALRSQMNPHFIFNALNSIRRYILENDADNADFYLTSFATLMRKVLDNSKYEFISLEEEINTLKLYLELEKMRFDDSFTFNLQIDENIKQQAVFLPTMILQPLLENAIWHGLAPLNKDGLLTLSIKKIEDKSFVCIIDDNGIGRDKAAEIALRRKGHKSTGVKNLQERIHLLNTAGVKKIELNILDKFDPKGNSTGTQVEVKFLHVVSSNKKRFSVKILGKRYYFRLK